MADLLTAQLEAFGLDEAQRDYCAALVNDPDLEHEDKLEAVLATVDPDQHSEDEARTKLLKLFDDLKERQSSTAASQPAVPAARTDFKSAFRSHSPEPAASQTQRSTADGVDRARREELLRQYADVEDEVEEGNAPPALAQSGVTAKSPRKSAGKASSMAENDLLLVKNNNAAAVKDAEKAKREASAKAAASKREKDKLDLEKQRAGQTARKEAARKKAEKSERQR